MKVIVEMDIDFALLKTQKKWLLNQAGEEAEGLMGIIDDIQDQAAKAEVLSEMEIFDYGEDY
jgi:hypothetical protein